MIKDTVHGMNFERMPELHWLLGYALVPMVSVTLYLVFERRTWL